MPGGGIRPVAMAWLHQRGLSCSSLVIVFGLNSGYVSYYQRSIANFEIFCADCKQSLPWRIETKWLKLTDPITWPSLLTARCCPIPGREDRPAHCRPRSSPESVADRIRATGQAARRWAELVLHKTGGIVQGQLLVLDIQKSALDELREWLWEREGEPPLELVKQMVCESFGCVLYCDPEATLKDEDINPESLTQFAIDSVEKSPARNAIRYLAQNIKQGIITPLAYAYRDAILRRTGKETLTDAERIVMGWFRDR